MNPEYSESITVFSFMMFFPEAHQGAGWPIPAHVQEHCPLNRAVPSCYGNFGSGGYPAMSHSPARFHSGKRKSAQRKWPLEAYFFHPFLVPPPGPTIPQLEAKAVSCCK